MSKRDRVAMDRRHLLARVARWSVVAPALAGLLPRTGRAAGEAAYPARAVRLVVPYPPGGATDAIGRIVARRLQPELGQPVVVDNRGGAAGALGATAVAREKADGHVLLMAAITSHTMNAALFGAALPFDIEKSFVPVALVGRLPLVVLAGRHVPAADLAAFIARAKARPGTLTYASSGNGSPQHLAAELFQRMAGIRLLHVPYKGSGPALADLVGGQIDLLIDSAPAAHTFVRSGQLRGLATAAAQRLPALPEVPTAREAGLPGFEVASSFGVLAPAGTPPAVVGRLDAALRTALADPDVRQALAAQGVQVEHGGPAQAALVLREELARWSALIRERKIKPD